ncbi:hypothetical protein ACFQEX_09355 [Roseibium salinum]|uniref:hypothetical protein n=1 Tax=Roseibium salinum TaxID=1604349 RepID=UPI003606C6F6
MCGAPAHWDVGRFRADAGQEGVRGFHALVGGVQQGFFGALQHLHALFAGRALFADKRHTAAQAVFPAALAGDFVIFQVDMQVEFLRQHVGLFEFQKGAAVGNVPDKAGD